MRNQAPKAVAVYRMFDADGQLLYIGQSNQPWVRPMQKLGEADWPLKIANIAVRWFPTREEAMAEEERLIKKLMPPFNVQHNPKVKAKRPPSYGGLVLARWLERRCMTADEFAAMAQIAPVTVHGLLTKNTYPISRTSRAIESATDGEIPDVVWERGARIWHWSKGRDKAIQLLAEVGIEAVIK